MKDLLIAGNDQVQAAIDKYEAGDSSALEEMIRSGAFSKSVDVDLLGDLDLDLDFLNVHVDDDLVFGNMDDLTGNDSVSQQQIGGGSQRVGKTLAPMNVKLEGDGLGESEFNYASAKSHDMRHGQGSRIRTNSLALPGMMLDDANQDYCLGEFGQWMDSDLPNLINSSRQAPSSDATMINADGSSGSFKLQCDLLMQREGTEGMYSSSPAAVRSLLTDKHIIPKRNDGSKPSTNTKKEKKPKSKKADSSDGKKVKKKSSVPNEAYSTNTIPFIKREKGGDGSDDENKEVPSGLGRPRSMSDPNLNVRLDERGLLHVEGPKGWVGAYSPDSREIRIKKFLEKRNHRVWVKKVKYGKQLLY